MADLQRLEDALKQAGGQVTVAGPADTVDGVPAAAVARPTSADGVAAVLREATAQGLVTVARGAATALDWGAPPERVDLILDTTGLHRLVEHGAGDLVVVAEAGLPVAELSETVRAAAQELVVDLPPERLAAGSTVGGALSTGASGPRRLQRGALRDLVLGATVVLADGTTASSGGKVVKNVAGYDLAKLLTGAYGTLGVVVRAAFRLHPARPDRAYAVATGRLADVAARARDVVASQLAPAAVEIDRPAGSDVAEVAVLIEGTGSAVGQRAAAVAELLGGRVQAEAPRWWAALPGAGVSTGSTGGGGTCAKATATLTGVAGLLAAARDAEQRYGVGVALRGSAAGVLHALVTGTPEATAAAVGHLRGAATHPRDGTVTVLRASREVRAELDAWGPVGGLDLMRAVKRQLDPGRNLAPGRFVGGI
ncbi:glycolate oxidase FAD binding subunit [Promicromonospora umidemergens]|uniref:FAD-binding oxidoreductase n=1 Tax=Promicromonospora umidemergens TaxID=629679 RepID=A0ABP8YC80_9MICO|nr:FAD-binding oxidoreductase [Promicromonospora umidemergens]MCP2282303.1 glycolate oxidase FAD binding subunit [Promicromonospora umidemergens]